MTDPSTDSMTDTSQQASIPVIRHERPRLFRPADDPGFRYEAPADPVRRRILSNLLDDCELFAGQRPWRRVPRRAHSPHPNHQLYLTFYTAMQATALIENYAFAWRLTGDPRWLGQARAWLRAAANWDHGDHVEEHFYTVNRYMQAFALALDLMDEVLPEVGEAPGPRLPRGADGSLVAVRGRTTALHGRRAPHRRRLWTLRRGRGSPAG